MKNLVVTITLITLAFIGGSTLTSRAAPEGCCAGMLCSESFISTSKPLIADAGFTATQSATFTNNFTATKGGNSISLTEFTANILGASGASGVAVDFETVPGVTAIGDVLANGNQTLLKVDDVQKVIILSNVPSTDPQIVGAIYSDNGVLRISGG